MAISYYLADLLSRHFFLGENLASPCGTTPYLALLTGQSSGNGDNWIEVDKVTKPSYHREAFYPILEPDRYYIYQVGNIEFPRVTEPSGWGAVIGVGLYDRDGIPDPGNILFDLPWVVHDTFQKIPSFPFDSGCRVTFPAVEKHIVFKFGGKEYDIENGSISQEYSKVIMDWIFNFRAVPYPRTYDMAIGRGADLNLDNWGRWNGIWSECQGEGYNPIALTADDWEQDTPLSITNKNEIVFTEGATDDWGNITDIILFPHGNTAHPAFLGHLGTSTYIHAGDGFAVGASQFKVLWEGDSIN
jgi:hypothetical protein